MSDSKPAAGPGHMVRGLGLLDGTMLVAGSMIGSGIFIVPADMARELGSAGWLLSAWVLTGMLTLAAALSYGELAAMMPRAGGQYVYLREAYGPLWGFLYGWTLFLVIQTGTIAAVAVAFSRFLGVLVPSLSESYRFFGWGRFALTPTRLVAILVLALLTWSNSRGLRTGKTVQNIFTLTKIAALAALIGLGLTLGARADVVRLNLQNFWNASSVSASGGPAIPIAGLTLCLAGAAAMVGSLFSADAWNNVTFTAGEVKNPQRNLPLSLGIGVGLVCLLYLLSNVAYLSGLPLHGDPNGATATQRGLQFATNDRVGTAMMEGVFGAAAAEVMAGLILISTFGCMNGMILAGARVQYAMAQDRLFFQPVGTLNRAGVPAVALWVQCGWACLLTLSGTYGDLLDYVIFAVLIFYVLTMGAVFVLRSKRPDAPRPYRAWGYPWATALYMLIASLIALGLLISPKTRGNAWPGLIIVLAGCPVYWLWHHRRQRQTPSA